MKTNTLPILVVLSTLIIQYTTAHTYLSSINGLSEFDCIRPERPTYERNSPIVDITSQDMTCGWLPYASQPANRKCPVSAGDTVTLQFWHDGPYADDFIIDSSHRGPCIMYMAAQTTGTPKWFKIWENGLDSNNKFCVDYLRSESGFNGAGKGKLKVQIPTYLPTGNYLLRSEIIALHEGYAIGKAQFYVNCVELSVTNSAYSAATVATSAIPTVTFPGTYSVTDPGIFYNLYGGYLPTYIIPGPAVFKPSSYTPSTPAPATPAPVTPAPATPAPVTPAPATPAPVTPSPTTKPPTAPTTAPTPSAGGSGGEKIHIQIHPSSTIYWLALRVAGPSQETIKIELRDSVSFSAWTPFSNTNWGYFVFASGQVTTPASLRLTSVSGQVVQLDNILATIVGGTTIATVLSYSSPSAPSTTAPVTAAPVTAAPVTAAPVTAAPVTAAPVTAAPTSKPNAPPTAGPVTSSPYVYPKAQVHAGASEWWYAVAIIDTGSKTVASVQVKDSTQGSTYVNLAPSDWGYWVYTTPSGKPLIAPLALRVTSTVGTSIVIYDVPVTAGVVAATSML